MKKIYLQPKTCTAPMDTETLYAATPGGTEGLDDDMERGDDDDEDEWANAREDFNIWDNAW